MAGDASALTCRLLVLERKRVLPPMHPSGTVLSCMTASDQLICKLNIAICKLNLRKLNLAPDLRQVLRRSPKSQSCIPPDHTKGEQILFLLSIWQSTWVAATMSHLPAGVGRPVRPLVHHCYLQDDATCRAFLGTAMEHTSTCHATSLRSSIADPQR